MMKRKWLAAAVVAIVMVALVMVPVTSARSQDGPYPAAPAIAGQLLRGEVPTGGIGHWISQVARRLGGPRATFMDMQKCDGGYLDAVRESLNDIGDFDFDLNPTLETGSVRIGAYVYSADDVDTFLVGFRGRPRASVVERAGGEVLREFTLVDVLTVRMPAAAAEGLLRNPRVEYVEPNYEVVAHDQKVPWGIDRVFGDESYSFPTWGTSRGEDVAVAVLDTGIDEDHEDLPELLGGVNTIDDTPWGSDGSGHGTHVAGTIAALDNDVGVVGVGPEIGLYAVKVLDDGGSGTLDSVVAGIEWAVKEGIPILNMSLGIRYSGFSRIFPPISLRDACDKAYGAGHLLVSSAGNDGSADGTGDNVSYPARFDSVIAVAASDDEDDRASFSSTGGTVELIAPGVGVLSTIPGDKYEEYSGTSMASPHVAGVAALVWGANEDLTNAELREILQKTAEDLELEDNQQGHGLVRADRAVETDEEEPEYGVRVVAPEDAMETEAATYTYTFKIENTGTGDDTYNLTVASDDEEFKVEVQENATVRHLRCALWFEDLAGDMAFVG